MRAVQNAASEICRRNEKSNRSTVFILQEELQLYVDRTTIPAGGGNSGIEKNKVEKLLPNVSNVSLIVLCLFFCHPHTHIQINSSVSLTSMSQKTKLMQTSKPLFTDQ